MYVLSMHMLLPSMAPRGRKRDVFAYFDNNPGFGGPDDAAEEPDGPRAVRELIPEVVGVGYNVLGGVHRFDFPARAGGTFSALFPIRPLDHRFYLHFANR
jgi:hypothetical protein